MYLLIISLFCITILLLLVLGNIKENFYQVTQDKDTVCIRGCVGHGPDKGTEPKYSENYHWCALNQCSDVHLQDDKNKHRMCVDICINKHFLKN